VTGGCFGRECEGDFAFHGGGSLIDPDTYQTTAMNAPWLPYTHQRTWIIDTSLLGARPIDWVTVYVSADPEPNKVPGPNEAPSNYTIASGNIGEILQARGGDCPWNGWSSCITIHNDTCANFYMRAVVHASGPRPADGGAGDASTDSAPEGGADSAGEASADATTE
jgi:hypothetical protein